MDSSAWAMDRLTAVALTDVMELTPDTVLSTIRRRSFCTLATTSTRGQAHVAGMIYEAVGADLYIGTGRASRKARNIEANPRVGVCIPVRRLPVGPPSSVQFQGRAELLGPDDPTITDLLAAGRLKAITSHGELQLPDLCFVRIAPGRRLHTFGLGMSLWQLLRQPLEAGGHVDLAAAA
jgi:general stress protein 26